MVVCMFEDVAAHPAKGPALQRSEPPPANHNGAEVFCLCLFKDALKKGGGLGA